MKTMKVPVGKYEIEVPTIRGLPIDTQLSDDVLDWRLAQITGFLAVDWDGDVNKVIPIEVGKVNIETLDDKYFEPVDNANLSLFAYNANGDVTLGMACYTEENGWLDSDNPVQRMKHICIVAATSTTEQ